MMDIGLYLTRCTAAGRLGWFGAFEKSTALRHSCLELLNRSRLWQTVSEWVVSELVRASDWHARRGRTSVQRPFNSLRALAAVHQDLLKMIRTVLCFLGLLVGGSQGMHAWLWGWKWEVWENRLALRHAFRWKGLSEWGERSYEEWGGFVACFAVWARPFGENISFDRLSLPFINNAQALCLHLLS